MAEGAYEPNFEYEAAVRSLAAEVGRQYEHHVVYGKGSGEVRTVNPDTGGEKGVKPARFDLLPASPLWQVAEHYGKGAEKYEDRNWERGYEWSKSFQAMQRHAWSFWNGETYDPETGSHHLAAVVFHALALMQFTETHPELDDRP